MDSHTLRILATQGEYHACTELQEEVWGEGFKERVSAAILMIANRLGGLVVGAYREDGVLDGFVFGLTGLEDGELVHWSDMLAVRSGIRDKGLGSRLKRHQREVLLARGIRKMHWTFDPLQGRNAHINFSKLGIVCREYVPDMYGETHSPLHRGIGTDRLIATWEMDSERVVRRLAGEGGPRAVEEWEGVPRVLSWERRGPFPLPADPSLDRDEPVVLLPVPEDMEAIMEADLPLAVLWRVATKEPFQRYLSRGYEIREFVRGAEVSHYLLEKSGA